MEFFGQPKDSPDYAYALFTGDVHARTEDSSMVCQRMKAVLDGPVSFRKAVPVPGADPAVAPEPEPQPERSKRITLVHCLNDVELIHRKLNPTTGQLDQKGRVVGQDVKYNLVSGRFLVDGEGDAWLYKAEAPKGSQGAASTPGPPGGNPDRPAPAPPAPNGRRVPTTSVPRAPAAGLAPTTRTRTTAAPVDSNQTTRVTRRKPAADAPPPVPLELTRITFHKRVEGRFLAEDAEDDPGTPMLATFLGTVQVIHAKVPDEDADLSADNAPPGFFYVTSEKLDVVREAPIPGTRPGEETQEQFFIDAEGGRPGAVSPPWAIAANRITYDSLKDLVYAYGDENGVQFGYVDRPGQPPSYTSSRAVMFNRRTQNFQAIEPKSVLLVDPRSGIRAVPGPSGGGGGNDKKAPAGGRSPRSFPRVPQGDKERKGYNGR